VFYKHERLEKKLREHGRTATAEILSMRTEGSGNSVSGAFAPDEDLTASWTLCWMKLRVTPEGEPPFEVSLRTRLNTFKYKGDTVPVLYDPDDHDKVVVDYEADARAAMEGRTGDTALGGQIEEFNEHAAEFREQAEGFRESAEIFGEIARAKAAGDQAEVDRLKAEFLRRRPPQA
jgi:hypothetical protein